MDYLSHCCLLNVRPYQMTLLSGVIVLDIVFILPVWLTRIILRPLSALSLDEVNVATSVSVI
jgi:hypothetical protein